jgi:hypothetical protein
MLTQLGIDNSTGRDKEGHYESGNKGRQSGLTLWAWRWGRGAVELSTASCIFIAFSYRLVNYALHSS